MQMNDDKMAEMSDEKIDYPHTISKINHMEMSEMKHSCCGSMDMPMDHHMHMAMDFKHRFFFSFLLMIPILLLSPMIQMFMGVS